MFIPQLSDNAKCVLRMIRAHGVCAGFQLLSEARLEPGQLSEVANELLKAGLISANGSTAPQEIEGTFFNVQPSNVQLAEYLTAS